MCNTELFPVHAWSCRGPHQYELVDSLPRSSQNTGVRYQCADIDTLKACLLAYFCRCFGDADERAIDAGPWCEEETEFDPRTFQAFTWKAGGR